MVISLKEADRIVRTRRKDDPIYYALLDRSYRKVRNKNAMNIRLLGIHVEMANQNKT